MNDLHNPAIKTKEFDFDWRTLRKTQFNRIPPLRELTIMQTKNTWRICYRCRGSKFVELNHTDGHVTMRTCEQCKGLGMNYN